MGIRGGSVSTGAANGKAGGRIGSGTRARNSLQKIGRFKIVTGAKMAPVSPGRGKALLATADAIAVQMGLSPASSKIVRMGVAAGAAYERSRGASSSSGAGAASPPPPQQLRRGATLQMLAVAKYGAGRDCQFTDVCRVCTLVADGTIKKAALGQKNAKGQLKYRKVLRTTMVGWLKDDAEVMKLQGMCGVKGSPHWLVERDVRRRTVLDEAGRPPSLGASEKALMVACGNAAKTHKPYTEAEVEDMVRETAIELGLVCGGAYCVSAPIAPGESVYISVWRMYLLCISQREAVGCARWCGVVRSSRVSRVM